ncbi:LOW QUALITY PROTEIN: vacuolar protein sorting-associated protein 8 homolog [Amphiura filiformis]|uniref:LOW QUALITY PROTEIN: vacuolar protein sorting-associated protein 8 homolog n=1 Tax=Amphiura filiformis TaxID=82378 RepID=UPI003B217332
MAEEAETPNTESAVIAEPNLDPSFDNLDDITIDDDEFDIPEIENAPTLESILNEPEDAYEPDSQPGSLFSEATESESTASPHRSDHSTPMRQVRQKSIQYAVHGSIIRHVMLRSISSQVMSATDRVDAGYPTAMAVSMMIAIGSSHGLILVFDPKQVLKWCLGSTAVGNQYGAVSSLGINTDCTRLISGFARGQITMWDLTSGKLLRTITDAHPPGSAVLHIQFTDDPTLAICSDSGGSVFELNMKRVMGMRTCESRCLFSGSRGEVCAVAPLLLNSSVKDHPLKDVSLLAMATLSKVFIVGLRPKLTVLFTKQLKGDPTTLPLLAWQFVIIQVTDTNRVVDPVLAFGRTHTVHFYQVLYQEESVVKVVPLQIVQLPYSLLSLQWFNSRTVITVDTSEKLRLIDVRSEEELEVIDLSDIGLVYSSSHFKSLATGGNVSKALALAGERACYQSIKTHKGQLLALGTKSLHVMTLRTWHERIDLLVKETKFKEALSLANSFYIGRAKAVIGLGGNLVQKQAVVSEKILDMLLTYVDVSMKYSPERGAIHLLEEHFQSVVPVCVDHCLILGRTDILFGTIYDKFSQDSIAKGVFLECLEPYILNDKLNSVTPIVMQDFVEHYKNREMVENVEGCIVHMDIASLDIHQVVSLCWAHGLYDAIIYIHTKGMNDYVTPLEELFSLLSAAVMSGKQLTDQQIKLGNKILVYISCCLAGRAYPLGDIPPHLVKGVKEGVWQCLTALHTKKPPEEEEVFPHLKALLHYDTREFLNVLSLAFEEEDFDVDENTYGGGVQSRQRMVDILLQIMVESVGFSPAEIGCLFTFLARQMAKHESSILVNRLLFEQVLEFLADPSNETRHSEREQALLELLNAGGLQQVDNEKLLRLAEDAKFYRVCEVLYERQRKFDKILQCYLRDPARKQSSFAYIHTVMLESCYTDMEKEAVQKEALDHLQDLVSIDSRETAQLVLKVFAHSLAEIVRKLEGQPRLQFEFLQGVFDYTDSGSALYPKEQTQPDPVIHEKYIDLMCRYSEDTVLRYLMNVDGYRLEETLQIVRRHNLSDAVAYLLEKAGDIQGAFGIMRESLQAKIKAIEETATNQQEGEEMSIALARTQAKLMVIIQLCQRNSNRLEESGREALWFPLLDLMMATQRRISNSLSEKTAAAFKDLTRHVLNSMMGHIALPAILQKIMQDPAYSSGKFGEFRELLLGMLDTYNYEKTLLKTTNNLLHQDLYTSLKNLTLAANSGLVPRQECCFLCGCSYEQIAEHESTIVFSCTHTFHTSCLHAAGCSSMIDGKQHWTCFQCFNTRRGGTNRAGRNRSGRFSFLGATQGAVGGASASQAAGGDSGAAKKVVHLDPEQESSLEMLRKRTDGPSRFAILCELSRTERGHPSGQGTVRSDSILHQEGFKLRLAPEYLDEEHQLDILTSLFQ